MKSRTYIYIVFLLTVGVSFACIGVKPAQAVSEAGLVGYWKFDEGTGTRAADSSGNIKTGRLFNTPGWITAGKFGRALNITSGSQYVDPSMTFSGGSEVTYSAWVKGTVGGWCIVGNHATADGTGFLGNQSGTNFATFRYRNTGGGEEIINGVTTNIKDGQWHFLAGTASASGGSLYVDGRLENSSGNGASFTGGSIWVGISSGSNSFVGAIDDVRVYNRALSVAEIKSLYQSGGATRLAQPTQPNQSGLVGYWKLDEDTGVLAKDSTGNGNNGVLNGIAEPPTATSGWTSKGKMSRALTFDGSNDYIDAGNDSSLQLTSGTLSAWIKTSNAGAGYRGIFAKQSAFGMFLKDNVFIMYDWSGAGDRSTGISLNDNAWHHVVCSFQSGVSNGTKCYVDGSNVMTTTITVSSQSIALQIGWANSVGQYFAGSIDDVRIYNRALSASEVLALYKTTGNITKQASENGLVGYWKFDEGATNKADDSSGNGNRGTLTSMADPATAVSGWTNVGKLGRALNFDGSNDYVSLSQTSAFALSSKPFSVVFWVQPRSVVSSGASPLRIISWYDGSKNIQMAQYAGSLNEQRFYLYNFAAGANPNVGSVGNYPINVWHHVVGTFDGNATYHIYVDGVLADGDTTGGLAAYTGDSTTIYIGQRGDGRYFNGALDDLRIYNRALSATEIQVLYQSGTTRVNP